MRKKFSKLAGVLICILFAIALLFIKDKADVIWSVICNIASILTPFVYAFGFAYILNFPYKFFENKVFSKVKAKWFQKINKPLSLTVVYLLFIGLVGFLIAILIPQLTDNINKLVDNFPVYVNTFLDNIKNVTIWMNNNLGMSIPAYWTNTDTLISKITTNASKILSADNLTTLSNLLFPAVYGTAMFFYNFTMSLIISVYMLSSKELLCSQVKRFSVAYIPRKFLKKLYKIVDVTDNKCGKYLVGQFLVSTIIALLCFISMKLLNIPYAPLISVVVGITNVIPFFGPFIGGIPCALLLLLVSPLEAFKFVIMIFLLQQIEGNFICPKIVGSQVGLVGFWSLFSVILSGGLFGFPGMIIGTPIFAAIYTLIGDRVDKKIALKEDAEQLLETPVIKSSNLTQISIKFKKRKKKKTDKDKQDLT